jgi:hypothetical protein
MVVSGFWRNDHRKPAPGTARTLEGCQNFGVQHHPADPSKPILDHRAFGAFCHPCRGEAEFPGAVPVVAPQKNGATTGYRLASLQDASGPNQSRYPGSYLMPCLSTSCFSSSGAKRALVPCVHWTSRDFHFTDSWRWWPQPLVWETPRTPYVSSPNTDFWRKS